MNVRRAEAADVAALARLWYEGWRDAHLSIVPAELARLRTLDSFHRRLLAGLPNVRVAGPPGMPIGFYMLGDGELYQLYVAPSARGTGLAAALIADAESQLAARGVEVAWLACAIGNDRAARFYEKCGWRRTGTVVNRLDASTGAFALRVWRYEKAVR